MTRSRVAPRSLVLLSLAARSTAPDRSRPDRSRPDSLLPVKSAGLSDVAAASTVSTCARVISASIMSEEVRSTWRIISCAAAAPLKPQIAHAAANARASLIAFLRSNLQDQERTRRQATGSGHIEPCTVFVGSVGAWNQEYISYALAYATHTWA